MKAKENQSANCEYILFSGRIRYKYVDRIRWSFKNPESDQIKYYVFLYIHSFCFTTRENKMLAALLFLN